MLSFRNLHFIRKSSGKRTSFLIKIYRVVQQWGHWLDHLLGQTLLKIEKDFLSSRFSQRYGTYALLIGVPQQHIMLTSLAIRKHVVLGPLINKNKEIIYIESAYIELPIASGSVDLVILPHTLDFLDNPRRLLNEACRIVKPEGEIVIFGFNPYSLWGLKKWWSKHHKIPWSGNFISAIKVKNWLMLADFQLVKHDRLMFIPPVQKKSLLKGLNFLEWLGSKLNLFFGGVYVITARAKIIPLTPIKLHWKQKISTLHATIPGPSMRDMR